MISPEAKTTVEALLARRVSLVAQLWSAAEKVAESDAPELLTQLVRLKADIEAIDFTLQHAPPATPDEVAEGVNTKAG